MNTTLKIQEIHHQSTRLGGIYDVISSPSERGRQWPSLHGLSTAHQATTHISCHPHPKAAQTLWKETAVSVRSICFFYGVCTPNVSYYSLLLRSMLLSRKSLKSRDPSRSSMHSLITLRTKHEPRRLGERDAREGVVVGFSFGEVRGADAGCLRPWRPWQCRYP